MICHLTRFDIVHDEYSMPTPQLIGWLHERLFPISCTLLLARLGVKIRENSFREKWIPAKDFVRGNKWIYSTTYSSPGHVTGVRANTWLDSQCLSPQQNTFHSSILLPISPRHSVHTPNYSEVISNEKSRFCRLKRQNLDRRQNLE